MKYILIFFYFSNELKIHDKTFLTFIGLTYLTLVGTYLHGLIYLLLIRRHIILFPRSVKYKLTKINIQIILLKYTSLFISSNFIFSNYFQN